MSTDRITLSELDDIFYVCPKRRALLVERKRAKAERRSKKKLCKQRGVPMLQAVAVVIKEFQEFHQAALRHLINSVDIPAVLIQTPNSNYSSPRQ